MATNPVLEAQVKIYLPTIFSDAMIAGTLIAIQTLMCSYCLYSYIQMPKDVRRTRRLYIIMSWVLFFLYTFSGICGIKIKYDKLTKPTTSLELLELETELAQTWYSIASFWAIDIILWLGDGLLVYRCFIVWTNRRIVTLFPAALYLAFVALTFYGQVDNGGSLGVTPALQTTIVCLSAAVNSVVALLITWRLVAMQRRQAALQTALDTTVYMSIIGIVVESAIPYALSSIFYAICFQQYGLQPTFHKGWKIALNVSTLLWNMFCVISPQLIIWRVTLGHSFAHSAKKTSILSSLAFNRKTVNKHSNADSMDEFGGTDSNNEDSPGAGPRDDLDASEKQDKSATHIV